MFCSNCGKEINDNAVVCINCGCKTSNFKDDRQKDTIIINNSVNNTNTVNTNMSSAKAKNKWISFILCLFLGFLGAHKFYEGKILMGILYLFTLGIFGIGIIVDLIIILLKPNPYYV